MLKKNQKGFGLFETRLALIVVLLVGFGGYWVWHNHHKTTPAKSSSSITTKISDPYVGWKTYNSILNSGLSFKYPPDWSFTPPTQAFTNNDGGQNNFVTLYSVKPQTKPGEVAAPTNQFMCVAFDEYGGAWQISNWNLGTLLSSENFQSSGTTIMLNTYKGDTPMKDQMLLITNPSDSHGNHYISTKNNYYVSVIAQFNCQQGGFPANADLNADFTSQPETVTAKLIMKSIKL